MSKCVAVMDSAKVKSLEVKCKPAAASKNEGEKKPATK